MNRFIRNEDPRIPATVTPESDGGLRIEERGAEPPVPAPAYGGYRRVIEGRGTVCVPLAASGDIPGPCPNLDAEPAMPAEEIQRLWNQVLAESNKQTTRQIGEQAKRSDEDKTKKLERLLRLALNSGDIDTAMLLFSSLESRRANDLAAGLMNRMQQLQKERQDLTASIGKSGDEKKDAQQAQSINAKVGDLNTEMNMLQTFLQDVQSHKNEVQQLASNYLKSRHDTAMGIIRNMG
ncbi:MAG TPA: hypothetical protein VLJ37_09985 [bacterium]|nr:hypothetical protein [bacterium]